MATHSSILAWRIHGQRSLAGYSPWDRKRLRDLSDRLQHIRLVCPPLSPRVCSNSCPLSQWCYLIISPSVTPIFSCLQSFPASGFFFPPMNQLFPSSGQSTGASASASVLPMNNQGGFPLGLTGLISLESKGFSSEVLTVSVLYHAHPCMKCSLDSSSFLKEISSLSHSVVFLLFICIVHLRRAFCLS